MSLDLGQQKVKKAYASFANSVLSPENFHTWGRKIFKFSNTKGSTKKKSKDGKTVYYTTPDLEEVDLTEADLVSSLVDLYKPNSTTFDDLFGDDEGGYLNSKNLHYPVIDIDINHDYIPSTTPGHGHLYFNTPVTWEQYTKLLDVLAECGIVEEGYVKASKARGYTAVRLPWVKKPAEEPNVGFEAAAAAAKKAEEEDAFKAEKKKQIQQAQKELAIKKLANAKEPPVWLVMDPEAAKTLPKGTKLAFADSGIDTHYWEKAYKKPDSLYKYYAPTMPKPVLIEFEEMSFGDGYCIFRVINPEILGEWQKPATVIEAKSIKYEDLEAVSIFPSPPDNPKISWQELNENESSWPDKSKSKFLGFLSGVTMMSDGVPAVYHTDMDGNLLNVNVYPPMANDDKTYYDKTYFFTKKFVGPSGGYWEIQYTAVSYDTKVKCAISIWDSETAFLGKPCTSGGTFHFSIHSIPIDFIKNAGISSKDTAMDIAMKVYVSSPEIPLTHKELFQG